MYNFLQVTQISSMSVTSAMTTVSIAAQTPMSSMFSQNACYVFWTANQVHRCNLVTSGLGKAIYRFLCFQNVLKRNINTKAMARKILVAELIFSASLISTNAVGYQMFGWEKALDYQFCRDMGVEQVEIITKYNNEEFNNILYKTLRFAPLMTAQSLILAELLIYVWIIYHLWKQDKKNLEDKIITNHMRKQRNQKNVITLRGQILTFLIELAYSIYIAIHASDFSLVDPSVMVISLIIASSTISVVQLLSSHEMMRFIRSSFNLY